MSDEKIGERVAALEAAFDERKEIADKRDNDYAKVLLKLDKIDRELSRYRGFVGGILLVVTAVVTFLKLFGDAIMNYFSK